MSTPIMVIGKSGTGKSTSIQKLNPKSTFIIGALTKGLPFRGWKKNYTEVTKENPTGNLLYTDDYEVIDRCINSIATKRPEINVIVIDDFQYLLANEFMRRAKEKGFEKFTEIGQHAWQLVFQSRMHRPDLFVVFLAHSDTNEHGETRCKTIGKMLDEKICLEGMFTIVLETHVEDGKYTFTTNATGGSCAKTPAGMMPNSVPNDLNAVIESVNLYEQGE